MRRPFYARLHSIINSDEFPDPAIHRYFEAARERKALIYAARNRKGAYLDIISKHTVRKGDRQDRVIVFHERIGNLEQVVAPMDRCGSGKTTEVNRLLEDLFFKPTFKPVMYHFGQSSGIWNETSMDFFRSGLANVMLSVRVLVEGVDVPTAKRPVSGMTIQESPSLWPEVVGSCSLPTMINRERSFGNAGQRDSLVPRADPGRRRLDFLDRQDEAAGEAGADAGHSAIPDGDRLMEPRVVVRREIECRVAARLQEQCDDRGFRAPHLGG